jgi:hypothetical protein
MKIPQPFMAYVSIEIGMNPFVPTCSGGLGVQDGLHRDDGTDQISTRRSIESNSAAHSMPKTRLEQRRTEY